MNPILLGRQVTEGLRDLVRSTFEISSPPFEGMMEDFLAEPQNFLKGPWISVDMPFRQDDGGVEPFPEIPMGFPPYLHQMRAFKRLSGNSPLSTVVATGTGSGKTECYMLPILDACRARKGETGIKAIIIYPMNALATDQARRIARIVNNTPALEGVRCGIYADAEPKPATSTMTPDDVITSRDEMRRNPPDILLTNYKMLDYLLLRGNDRDLWAKNAPETLCYLVVDELHTFDGAQGADLALLIRRLKSRLETPAGHLACIGSSATLGTGAEAETALTAYASDLFGEAFGDGAIIREDRKSAAELLTTPEFADPVDKSAIFASLAKSENQSQAAAAESLARGLFGDAFTYIFDGLSDPTTLEWRLALGAAVLRQLDTQSILKAIHERKGPAGLAEIAERLGTNWRYKSWEAAELKDLAEVIIALISWARIGNATHTAPLLNVTVRHRQTGMADGANHGRDSFLGSHDRLSFLPLAKEAQQHLKQVDEIEIKGKRCADPTYLT